MPGFKWIKIFSDLPTHHKAIELGCKLGNGKPEKRAWVYPAELWLWAVGNAPTGKIKSDFAEALIESACRWEGEKGQLFSALIACGFLDSIKGGVEIHDWEEVQKPHLLKAENDALKKKETRATGARRISAELALSAAYSPSPSKSLLNIKEKGGVEEKEETPLQKLYNEIRPKEWTEWRQTNAKRQAAAKKRMAERQIEGAGGWREVWTRLANWPFGRGEKGWTVNPDFALKADIATRALEGEFDNKANLKKNGRIGAEDIDPANYKTVHEDLWRDP